MQTLLYIALLFSFLFFFYKLIIQKLVQHKNLPPSPPSLPIIGHFHVLKKPIQCTPHKISKQYGPILLLKFGRRPVLVLSTPSAVEECFTKNDIIIFSSRPKFASRKQIDYNFSTLAMAPYGHHWRRLRRFTVLEIFSSTRIQMSSSIRTEEIRFFTKKLFTKGAQKVELKSFFYMLAFNIVMKMVSGNRYFEGDELDSDRTRHKYDDLKQTFTPTMTMALGDFLPFLRWLTFFGVQKKMVRVHEKRNEFTQALIDSHQNNKSSSSSVGEGDKRRTIIDIMLSLQESEPEFYTEDIMKGIIEIILVAGAETSAMTMESAGSFLIKHPEVFKKAREEIDANVEQSRILDDGVVTKLTYLHCIINEALRLGPTVPIIPPRESWEECTVGGFTIPLGTMLMVNAWAMHRDPNLWEDPDTFKPERFLGTEGEKGGFKFIPFGSGRRQCPGAGLAMRLMVLSLGTFIQCFDWEKAEKDGEDTGLDMAKDKPVEVIFRPHKMVVNALSQL